MEHPHEALPTPQPAPAGFARAGQVCGAMVVGLALLARLGWLVNWRGGATLGVQGIAMARNTALAYLLLGVALWGLARAPRARLALWFAHLSALAVTVLAALHLGELLTGRTLGTSTWDLPLPYANLEPSPRDQMASPTAITLLFACAALYTLTLPARRDLVGTVGSPFAVVVTALGLIFTFGYVYEAPFLAGDSDIPMALNTALAFVAWGVGFLATAGPEFAPLRQLTGPSVHARLLRAFLPFTALTVCLVAWLMHIVSHGQSPSVAALFSAVLVVGAIFPVSFICTHLTRHVVGALDKADRELREAERQSRTYAAELQTLNACLERRVTERTAALEESRDHLDQFFTITTALQDPDNVEKTFDLVLRFCQRLGYDQAMLSLVDRDAGVVRAVKAAGGLVDIVGTTVRPLQGDDILAVVVREGQTVVLPDCREDPRCDQAAVALAGIRGQMIVPLTSSGQVVGTLQVASRMPLNPTAEEVRTLETLGGQAARALAGLLHIQEIRRLNRQLEERNQQLQQLADDLAASALSERQAHAALSESEQRLQAILDNSTAVVYLKDTESRFLLINRRFETLFHVTRQQVQGKTNHELFPKQWADAFRANDLKVLKAKAPLQFEESVPLDDGLHTYISIKFPLYNAGGDVYGVCGISTDITRRKMMEEALRSSEERVRLIVDMAHDAFVAIDADGLVKEWNSQAEKLFGWTRDEVLGQPLNERIIPPQHREQHAQGMKHFLATGEGPVLNQRIELPALHRDGHAFPVELTITAIRLGQTYLFSSFLHDISERKRAEDQLRRQNTLLQEMAQSERAAHEALKKAQSQLVQSEKLAALGQLVAGVAHEINNPLSFVSNNVAVLQRDVRAVRELLTLYHEANTDLEQHRPELAARIRAAADSIDLSYTLENLDGLMARSRDGLKRIQQIVKDLRDFARLDESDLHEVDLNAGIESTINIIQGQARKQQVALELDLRPLPGVTCYPAKVNQVVLNLVVNAIDACPPGGKVAVATRPNGDRVEISVADTGTGIDPRIREKIFDPFFTTKPQGKGTGLGLSISYGIVRAHGGTIDFESELGRGTRFSVRLPRRPPPGSDKGKR
jgi:PAS domain S-box-containing protein